MESATEPGLRREGPPSATSRGRAPQRWRCGGEGPARSRSSVAQAVRQSSVRRWPEGPKRLLDHGDAAW